MKKVLRFEGDPGGDVEEPTPGAWPCIEEALEVDLGEAEALFSMLSRREHDYYDVLVYREGLEAYLKVFVGLECLQVIELRIRGCGENSAVILKSSGAPEVSKISLEGDCAEAVVPSDPPGRLRRGLKAYGISGPFSLLAYRISSGGFSDAQGKVQG